MQTVDPNSSTGARVFYPQGSINTSPVIRMSAQVVLGPGVSDRTPLGYLRICARFSVRGRRGLPLAANQLVMLMSDAERQLVYDYLAGLSHNVGARMSLPAGTETLLNAPPPQVGLRRLPPVTG